MKRTPLKSSTKPMKRTRIKPRSNVTVAAGADRDLVRSAVWFRDGRVCLLAGRKDVGPLSHTCWGGLTVHHLRKAAQGGRYEMGNLVTLCAFVNDEIENHPDVAHRLGLVCRTGDTVEECWTRMRSHGLVP